MNPAALGEILRLYAP